MQVDEKTQQSSVNREPYRELVERRIAELGSKGSRVWMRGIWLVGAVMALSGALVLMAIFAPVVQAEVRYQAMRYWDGRSADFEWLPRIVLGAEEDEWRMMIPSLYLQETIVLGVDASSQAAYMPALARGIAHAAGTAQPGEGGMGYYFAHSSGASSWEYGWRAQFYLLSKLKEGDVIWLERGRERFEYRVTQQWISEADDVSFLESSNDTSRIVLQTCWPVGTSKLRLLVMAEEY